MLIAQLDTPAGQAAVASESCLRMLLLMILACGPEVAGPYSSMMSSTHSGCALQLNVKTQRFLIRLARESILLNCGSTERTFVMRKVIEEVGFFGNGERLQDSPANLAASMLSRIQYLLLGASRCTSSTLMGEEDKMTVRGSKLLPSNAIPDPLEQVRGAGLLLLSRSGCLNGLVSFVA